MINREGYRTKVFRKEGKKPTGGNRWTRATLHRLLKNRLYLGEITDKRRNKCYPGEHEAIIDQTLWDKVQAVFKTDSWDRRRESCWKNSTAFLQGIIFRPDGLSLIPSHTRRQGKLSRYYVASKGLREHSDEMPLPPVAADGYSRPDRPADGHTRGYHPYRQNDLGTTHQHTDTRDQQSHADLRFHLE